MTLGSPKRKGHFRTVELLAAAMMAAALASVGCGSSTVDSGGAEAEQRVAELQVTAAVDRSTATVGDLVRFTLEAEYDADLLIDEFEVPAEMGDLEVVESGRSVLRVVRGRGALVDWIVLRGTAAGSYIIPPQTISGTRSSGEVVNAESGQVFVEIVSVLPSEANDIRGLKPLEESPAVWPWVVGGALAALLALAAWLWRRRSSTAEPVPELLAHERAFRDLEELRSIDFTDLEQLRSYYFSLSGIVRRYIEDRFGLNATDLTTQEIQHRLGEVGPLDQAQEDVLLEFCRATDNVKYAASVPSQPEIEQVYESALCFVEQTQEDPEDPAPMEMGLPAASSEPAGQPVNPQVEGEEVVTDPEVPADAAEAASLAETQPVAGPLSHGSDDDQRFQP